jgi:hypothetical protein
MAWAGKASGAQKTKASISSRRQKKSLPQPDCPMPGGIPTSILKQLGREGISDKEAYGRRLNELLAAYKG